MCVIAGLLRMPVPAWCSPETREKYRKVKEQRAAQGREIYEEHEEELRAQAELLASKMDDLIE